MSPPKNCIGVRAGLCCSSFEKVSDQFDEEKTAKKKRQKRFLSKTSNNNRKRKKGRG
jgi:hypothetical protein